jgi:acyl dehydratase
MHHQPHNTTIAHLADLPYLIGKEIGLSAWMEVSQEQIDTFGRVTQDEQWIHIDQERAREQSPYRTTIAHGFFVLSLASKFAYELMHFQNLSFAVNYGLDRVRFMNAVRVGARLRARMKLLACEEVKGGYKYKTQVTFELEGEEKPACVAEWLNIVYE